MRSVLRFGDDAKKFSSETSCGCFRNNRYIPYQYTGLRHVGVKASKTDPQLCRVIICIFVKCLKTAMTIQQLIARQRERESG